MIWTGVILLLAGFNAPGATNAAWFTRFWQTDDGLLNNNVNAIVQGRDSYLWVVTPFTPVGLMRFDGVSFSPYMIKGFAGILPHVQIMLRSRTDVLWVAAYGGTVIGLNPDYSETTLPRASLPTGVPIALAEDREGALWLGYLQVICRYKNGQVKRFAAPDQISPDNPYRLTSDGGGNIWLAQGNQISVFRNEQFQHVASMPGVQCLGATHTNGIWFVTAAHLFTCNTDGALQDCGTFQNPFDAPTMVLFEDHTGAVWIGTDGDGLFHYSRSGFERIETSHSSIVSISEDHEGNIWVGTAGGGLDRVSLNGVRLETLENSQVPTQIQSICQDTNGTLWGATRNGALISRVNGTWVPVFTNAPFAGTVACVAADDRGTVWIGTRDGKLLRLVNNNYTAGRQNTVHGAICALLPTSRGDLWIVGRHVQRLHDGQLRDVKLPKPVERITAITEDAAGNIWLGAKGTVMRFDGKSFEDESGRLPIADRPIPCLFGTPDGSLWIGCGSGGGLLRFKEGRVGQVRAEQGLFNDYISQIVADRHGWLWFGSDHGIFKIRQQELEQTMNDHNIRLRPIGYGRNEGLMSLASVFSIAPPFVFPRALLTRDGKIWLLTHTGIVVADPRVMPDNYSAPPVLLTRVAMDGQTIAFYGNSASTQTAANLKTLNVPLQLPPSHRHLEFDFTAFHFSAPEDIQFRYQLVGFDNDWIDAGTERHADYSRLTAGNYQFRVAACSGDGPWGETPATVSFTVVPFFWQTWWFRLGVLLLFATSMIAGVRYVSFRRLQAKLRAAEQLAAIERERARIARDIHDDLGNRLTEIQLLSGLAEDDGALQNNSVAEEISSAARQATDALDEIVWAINPRNDTLPRLINYLGQFVVEFLRTAGIRCRVDLPEQPPDKSVSAEVRHNLFLVVKESLNNIACHASASEVFVLILVTNEFISVIIEDNGRGFNGEAKNNRGDGLENMRQRIAEIGGQFQIKSKPGAGTSVSFNSPWRAKK